MSDYGMATAGRKAVVEVKLRFPRPESLMCAAGIEAIGLLEQEARQHRDDQRRTQCVECVAEGKDVGLFLRDMADRDIGASARPGQRAPFNDLV
jgi:hypothetical protein